MKKYLGWVLFVLLLIYTILAPRIALITTLKGIDEKLSKMSDFQYICNECNKPIAIFTDNVYCEDCVGKLKREIKKLRKKN